MKILLITQMFDPEPTLKGLAFARELTGLGHQVEVLTGFPNYPGGRLYDGYRLKLRQRETIDGVTVTRVPLYPSHDRSACRRIANYSSFAASSAFLGPAFTGSPDVAYVYHPPATVALAALTFRFLKGVPFVYDIQDLWPDTLRATGMVNSGAALRLVGVWCRMVYACASRIAVLSPGFRSRLIERGVAPEKIEVIYNWSSETAGASDLSSREIAEKYGLRGRFNIVFAGNLGLAQRLDSVLDAAAILAASGSTVQFVFIGGGVDADRLRQRAKSLALSNVRFIEWQPASVIGVFVAQADVLLVHLKRDPLFEITIPSKTQAAMAAGKPILMAVKGDAAELIEQAGAGLTCEPENPQSIASTALRFERMSHDELRAFGERGRLFYERELSIAVGARRFERLLLDSLVARRGHRPEKGR